MGRASREQAELNRKRVVETACRLFRHHGVENVSIADIMGAAGLTPGGFYKQFESREALINEAFALAFEQSSQAWNQVLEPDGSGNPDSLSDLVRHYFTPRSPERNCPMLAFASQVSGMPPECETTAIYASGTWALFEQFQEQAQKMTQPGVKQLSENDILVLFAAMLGTGFLTRALGLTPWTHALQSAVLEALSRTGP